MAGAAIDVRGLNHRYRVRAGDLKVLHELDLSVQPGEHVVITGVSGSGKSTLLALLGGLDHPQSGSVVVGGHDLHRLSRNALADYRRQTVGFVFQHFGLLDTLTAAENVELACALAGRRPKQRRDRAAELLAAVGLTNRAEHRATELSGGERQRVALARALANEPRLVLADEPTGNLDDESSERVELLLGALPAERGCTLVIVTHDHRLTRRAPRHLHLTLGRLRESGPQARTEAHIDVAATESAVAAPQPTEPGAEPNTPGAEPGGPRPPVPRDGRVRTVGGTDADTGSEAVGRP